jgi:hypothetical protein
VGFSHDQGTLRTMLASMLGADGGPPDKLFAVTRPLTGGYYVIPSAGWTSTKPSVASTRRASLTGIMLTPRV